MKKQIPSIDQDVEQLLLRIQIYKLSQSFWKTIWQYLLKLNNCMHFEAANLLPGINTTEIWIYVHRKTSSRMSIIALFIITPRKSNMSRINTSWYIYTIDYYSALKVNKMIPEQHNMK